MMELNAEPKSMNSIRTRVISPPGVKSGGDGILSEAVWPVGKLEGVKHGRESESDVLLYQLLKHFIKIGVSAMGR